MRYPEGRTGTLEYRALSKGEKRPLQGAGEWGSQEIGWYSRIPFSKLAGPSETGQGEGEGVEGTRRFPYKALQLREGD